MNKLDLEKIIAIAEEGSMAKAARKLFITQPALSKCLLRVEAELGEVLFMRHPSGMLPTYAGTYLVNKAYQIMKLYDDVEVEFCELNHMCKGTLKIGTAERIGALVLPQLLEKFQTAYPNIKIQIVEEDSVLLEEKCLVGAIDIAIVCLPLKNPNVKYEVFHKDPLLIAVPKNHPLNAKSYIDKKSGRSFLHLEDLINATFILTKSFKKTRIAANQILDNLHDKYIIGMESKNIETVIRLVASGMGISIVPNIYSKVYLTGQEINYYYIEDKFNPFWQWAILFNNDVSTLTRPSKELYNIIVKNKLEFPSYLKNK